MPLLQTDALVLHAANYLESSRLLRLLTREAGVQSVVARGARSSKKRFGSAVDLFAEGQAQIQTKPGRDLHGLNAFDVTKARTALALDLNRFTAANALAEVVLRLVHDEATPGLYETVEQGLDQLAATPATHVDFHTVGILWRLLSEVGFRPVVDRCVECLDPIPDTDAARFHVSLGGTLCQRCARLAPGGRLLPAAARATIRAWLDPAPSDQTLSDPAESPEPPEPAAVKAHQRLLREFLGAHVPDRRPLKAFDVWEKGGW
jgi:DNA repair protein RecO (recombination protein O)